MPGYVRIPALAYSLRLVLIDKYSTVVESGACLLPNPLQKQWRHGAVLAAEMKCLQSSLAVCTTMMGGMQGKTGPQTWWWRGLLADGVSSVAQVSHCTALCLMDHSAKQTIRTRIRRPDRVEFQGQPWPG